MNKYTVEDIRRSAEYITGKNFWEAGDLRFADGPAGLRMPGDKKESLDLKKGLYATSFPAHSALACSFNRGLCRGVGARIGEEAAGRGVDILLAPAVNIMRSPYNGRNFEYFSEDPYLTGELGAAYVQGVQSTGVGACVKHFAANNRETARSMSDSVISPRTLRELYLTAFEKVVKSSSPAAVMTSYNKLNGVYCNESRELVTGVLREEWGFKGLVVSDWNGTYNRVESVKAGADLEMPACASSTEAIVNAYSAGELGGEKVEECAARLKEASARPKPAKTPYSYDEHAEYAYKAACECAVLLKNDGVLPLAKGARVAVFGEAEAHFQGGGSSHLSNSVNSRLITELEKTFNVTGYVRGFKRPGKRAQKLVEKSDAVIVCLARCEGDTEGQDKKTLRLPMEQEKLVSALLNCGKKVICLLLCGGSSDTSWDNNVNALLYLGLSGQGTARAAAEILCGSVNPSGRLAESFFNDVNELPSSKYFNQNTYYTVYGEGLAVGYRYYLSGGVLAKYPFGYGLGYTNFTYSEPVATLKGVTFTVTNSGDVYGADVPQVYVEFPAAAHEISPRLAGFEKVFLKAGESKSVFIPFTPEVFFVYDSSARKNTVVSGKYTIYIAKNSQNFVFSVPIDIEGECSGVAADEFPQNAPALPQVKRDARGRVTAELLTPFCELENSKKLLTRLFVKAVYFLKRKDPMQLGTLKYSPVKTLAQYMSLNAARTEGFIQLLNGHYIIGLKLMIKGKK